ncbi:hypothetical protein [Helicobacter cynogastricus]|uniref:hypothetical protein n=1 Tax=Helicobacter cynogastricus TaxID=329937 RepID=UPI000CF13255|nr:hypothetical protein [Helicobacter cynogastricus]
MAINYIVDPFAQFRKAHWYSPDYTWSEERFFIPGLLRHEKFDNILAGASTEENIGIHLIKKYLHLQNIMKITITGAASDELYIALKLAFRMRKIHNVIYALNPYSFSTDHPPHADGSHTFPTYLYEPRNLTQVFTYLFSLRVFKKSVFYLHRKMFPPPPHESIDCWHHTFDPNYMFAWNCVETRALNPKHVVGLWQKSRQVALSSQSNNLTFKSRVQSGMVKYLESLIKAHPETHFILYYPPWSVLHYTESRVGTKSFEESFEEMFLQTADYMNKKLLAYPNVEIHDLRALPFVTDLNLYYDPPHFNMTKVGPLIFKALASKKYQVTLENNASFQEALKNLILNYKVPAQYLSSPAKR